MIVLLLGKKYFNSAFVGTVRVLLSVADISSIKVLLFIIWINYEGKENNY